MEEYLTMPVFLDEGKGGGGHGVVYDGVSRDLSLHHDLQHQFQLQLQPNPGLGLHSSTDERQSLFPAILPFMTALGRRRMEEAKVQGGQRERGQRQVSGRG